ncbi:MAG: hypothetical protein MEQ07_00100 [Aquimonas sp.]|nr:hypothetical protein [Aquimonas sp.]
MDARQILQIHAVGAREMQVALADGSRFRLDLAAACPLIGKPSESLQLLAREGWACPGQTVLITDAASGEACAVDAVAQVDSREFARLARESDIETRLATIEVQGTAPRGFRGSFDYCFNSGQMRSWHEDREGLVVEVRPRRSGGNQFYRVELDSACTELRHNATLALRSGAGNGLICGHAADEVVFQVEPVLGALDGFFTRAKEPFPDELSLVGSVGGSALRASPVDARCRIREVYPLASR